MTELKPELENIVFQQAEDIYNKLDEAARNYDSFEYGLPIFDKCKQPIIDVLTDYALKWQQAEEMMEKMGAILKQMAKGNPFPWHTTEKLLKEYNNYKQTKDGLV